MENGSLLRNIGRVKSASYIFPNASVSRTALDGGEDTNHPLKMILTAAQFGSNKRHTYSFL